MKIEIELTETTVANLAKASDGGQLVFSYVDVYEFGDMHAVLAASRAQDDRRLLFFNFETRIGGPPIQLPDVGTLGIHSSLKRQSANHYVGADVVTWDQIRAEAERDNDAEKRRLCDSLRAHGHTVLARMMGGDFVGSFCAESKVIDAEGNVIARGDTPELVTYRRDLLDRWAREAEHMADELTGTQQRMTDGVKDVVDLAFVRVSRRDRLDS